MKIRLSSLLLIFFLSITTQASAQAINSWAYQLQNYVIDDIVDYPADLIVMDFSKDGSAEKAFTQAEVAKIKDSGKKAISYISIGEAEDYRSYFDSSWKSSPPTWLDAENPDWGGNYKVKYWENGWQSIVYDYIDKIISAGFDGLYLDIVDGYEYYEDSNADAKKLMIDFVIAISDYSRNKTTSNFLIFPQNAEDLLKDTNYLSTVSGIGREDLYIVPKGGKRDATEIADIEENLDLLISVDKIVMVVDYTDDPDDIIFARESAREKGYLHYVGVLELDELVDQTAITESAIFMFQLWIIPVFVLFIYFKSQSRK